MVWPRVPVVRRQKCIVEIEDQIIILKWLEYMLEMLKMFFHVAAGYKIVTNGRWSQMKGVRKSGNAR